MVLESYSQFSVNDLLPANIAVNQELNTKDVIEMDRWLCRNPAHLALSWSTNEVIISPKNYLPVDANDLTMI